MFRIFNNTTIKFGFRDRLRILFGKKVDINTTLVITAQIDIIESTVNVSVHNIFGSDSEPSQQVNQIKSQG